MMNTDIRNSHAMKSVRQRTPARTSAEKVVWVLLGIVMLLVAVVCGGYGLAHILWFSSITSFGMKCMALSLLALGVMYFCISRLHSHVKSRDDLENGVKK